MRADEWADVWGRMLSGEWVAVQLLAVVGAL